MLSDYVTIPGSEKSLPSQRGERHTGRTNGDKGAHIQTDSPQRHHGVVHKSDRCILAKSKKKELERQVQTLLIADFRKLQKLKATVRSERCESRGFQMLFNLWAVSCWWAVWSHFVFFFPVAFSHFKTSKWRRMLLAVLLRRSRNVLWTSLQRTFHWHE